VRRLAANRTVGARALAVSWREAGRLLGVDRNRGGTLGEMVRSGVLRPIPWGCGSRFSLEDIQRVARTGWRPSGRRVRERAARPASPGAGVGDRIRAIEIADDAPRRRTP
jgi:hypothetical protein